MIAAEFPLNNKGSASDLCEEELSNSGRHSATHLKWDRFLTMALLFFFPVQPLEESQESFCKLKYVVKSLLECISMSKMKAGIRERQQARPMLGCYKVSAPGFSAS